ncbi:related to DNA-directed RNA polymerase II chain RPB9 [Cephalotrichum gorgonifer]|uniref:Related to DNA-directed RNA polymerase II chain RPB9 n=1 Tax=Cephalotrichum gorgonifer TaxID=2041049 RepID=A0AAE8N3Y6_9PEZI|nr:related to DNA-directed RNA polymerase II chain RPB9 [Cephalotrichum gorgonifer]
MASPGSTTSDTKQPLEQITFRFCSECSNMLYPKEDPENRQLLYTCRTCQYTEGASSSCVFRNVLNSASGETAGVTQDVASDPTVSAESVTCLLCGCFITPCATSSAQRGQVLDSKKDASSPEEADELERSPPAADDESATPRGP